MRNEEDRRFAQTLARGLQVLRAFKASDGPLGNQELATRTQIPKPTISRLTFTLSELGFLEHLPTYEKYRLGPAAMALGSVAHATVPFVESAAELMQPLADELEALVALTMRDGDRMLLTHCWRPQGAPCIWISSGFRMPLIGTSTGLAYLASLDSQQAAALISELTVKSESNHLKVMTEVQESKRMLMNHGFLESFGKWNPGIFGVSVPFRTHSFSEPLVFLCGAPAKSSTKKSMRQITGPKLAERVRQLNGIISGGIGQQ